ISPPEEVVFIPQEGSDSLPPPAITIITPTTEILLTQTSDEQDLPPEPTQTPTQTLAPTPVPTPIPQEVHLSGIRHEYQSWNNCGPATLSMALSFWGWEGDQRPIAAQIRPNPRDKNVMPYEMADFVRTETEYGIIVRVGGELELIKQLLAAGFPVMVEKGVDAQDGWLGHYVVVSGFDDNRQVFTLQDSLRGPNLPLSYDQFESHWRSFNFTYLVIYPMDKESEVVDLLHIHADETTNHHYAAQKASDEIFSLTGRDQYFAWFNRGTNLVRLQDFAGAAAAYDQAFALYPSIPASERPWRMLWYQTGPYFAYFYTGRYHDVINLATTTLDAMSEPVLEESYYWRALALEALGDLEGAVSDFRASLEQHPGFGPSLEQLRRLGFEN
ncbi:MAG: C39 family peptidase, partial [Anaerolineales bacterium]|nr:C39 family peptidase [Anaerolineales bacterium]